MQLDKLIKLNYFFHTGIDGLSRVTDISGIPNYALSHYDNPLKNNYRYIYLNPDSIFRISEIKYKEVDGNIYYCFYIELFNEDIYWICTKDKYTYNQINQFLPDDGNFINVSEKTHMNQKR